MMKLSNKTRMRTKRLLLNLLGNAHIRTSKEKDVFIFTSSRSGSTWLVETLMQAKNTFMLYNQPCDRLLNQNVYDALFPRGNPYLVNLSEDEKTSVANFLKNLKNDKYFNGIAWGIFQERSGLFYKRKLFKTFFLKHQYRLLLETFDFYYIYLTRHPVTRAISNIKYGYPDGCIYLFDDRETLSIIGERRMEKMKKIYRESGKIERHILGWFLENYPLLHHVENHPGLLFHITYEDMIKNRGFIEENFLRDLSIKVNFSDKPSKTVKSSGLDALKTRKESAGFSYSLDKFDKKKVANIMEIFETFPQTFYSIRS